MIDIKNVSFGYTEDKEILKDINFHIKQGKCILLCGRSGCGKTTITKLINGLIPYFAENSFVSGKVQVDNMDTQNTPIYELSKKIGSVFQNPKTQFFNVDSDSELAFGLENEGASYDFIRNRIEEATRSLKIEKLRHRSVFDMSGGEKQSLAFASVYAINPDVYVLDEPSANLDFRAVEVLKKQLENIKAQGKTIVIAEHRIYYLSELIDRVFYVDNGKISFKFKKEEFLAISDENRVKMGLRTVLEEKLIEREKVIYNRTDDLCIESLSCAFNNNLAFKDISFSANKGDIVGIIGHNGAGKTTLVRCISGLIKEVKGKIYFKGKTMNCKKRNKLCYMIMQDVNHQLFSDSVWGECELSMDKTCNKDIENVLKIFSLYDFKDSHPMALSGGQKQRLAVATGVLSNKKVIIFDEPTSGLDYGQMVEVSKMIKKLSKDGHIILIISHDTEFLNLTCTKMFTMNKLEK